MGARLLGDRLVGACDTIWRLANSLRLCMRPPCFGVTASMDESAVIYARGLVKRHDGKTHYIRPRICLENTWPWIEETTYTNLRPAPLLLATCTLVTPPLRGDGGTLSARPGFSATTTISSSRRRPGGEKPG